jgi:hypothetical protein
LFGQLRALGFTGSYARVSEYVRRWRRDGAKASKAAFIPLKFRTPDMGGRIYATEGAS